MELTKEFTVPGSCRLASRWARSPTNTSPGASCPRRCLLDPPETPPCLLLNLAFSTQAAYAAPLILLAGNRAAAHDRATLEHAAALADVEEKQDERLIARTKQSLEHLTEVADRTLAIEEILNAQDEQLLRMEKAILAFERDRSDHRRTAMVRGRS